MTVRLDPNGVIVIEGHAGVEDADPLLQLLLANAGAAVDWSACTLLHTAVYQVLLALRPRVASPCGDPWIARWLGV